MVQGLRYLADQMEANDSHLSIHDQHLTDIDHNLHRLNANVIHDDKCMFKIEITTANIDIVVNQALHTEMDTINTDIPVIQAENRKLISTTNQLPSQHKLHAKTTMDNKNSNAYISTDIDNKIDHLNT